MSSRAPNLTPICSDTGYLFVPKRKANRFTREYVTLHFKYRCGAALIRYAEIAPKTPFFMCETEALSSIVFVPAKKLPGIG